VAAVVLSCLAPPALDALAEQVMFASGVRDRPERELVAGVASAARDCFY